MVECLTPDQAIPGLSLTESLCCVPLAKHFILTDFHPEKHPAMTEKLLTGTLNIDSDKNYHHFGVNSISSRIMCIAYCKIIHQSYV